MGFYSNINYILTTFKYITDIQITMSEENNAIDEFKYTSLVEIKPGKSNLMIDTAKEWQKGFVLVNSIVARLGEDIWDEQFEDDNGNTHTRTHINQQLLPWVQERRRLMEQFWKISGGEAVVEGQKQAYRNLADMIFSARQDEEFIKIT